MKKSAKKSAAQSCDINFSKLRNRSVKVFLGAEQTKSVEIIGSRGKYAIVTDSNNEKLAKLRGKTGSLKEVKKEVASYLCGMQSEKKMPVADPGVNPEPVVQNQNPSTNGEQ